MMAPGEPFISICVAAYNEQQALAETVGECARVLHAVPGSHEILVVDDGSVDRTREVLEAVSATVGELRYLVHQRNLGYAAAQRTLIREARGELIFHVPADGEMKASELPKFLAKLAEGYDIVVGVRENKEYTRYRRLVSCVYNRLIVLLFGVNLRDVGGMRLATSAIWKQLAVRSGSATCMAERLVLAQRGGARIGFVSITHHWRRTGRSKFNHPWAAFRSLIDLLRLRLRLRGVVAPRSPEGHPESDSEPDTLSRVHVDA